MSKIHEKISIIIMMMMIILSKTNKTKRLSDIYLQGEKNCDKLSIENDYIESFFFEENS